MAVAAIPGCTAVPGSVRTRSNSWLHRFPRLEAVKYASDRVGGQLGRRGFGGPFVLVHRLLGVRQQLVDPNGALGTEVCNAHAQRQRGQLAGARLWAPG